VSDGEEGAGVGVCTGSKCGSIDFDGVSDGLFASCDTEGRTQLPARSKPKGQLTDWDEDGDEGGEVSWAGVTGGEFEWVGVTGEEGGGEERLSSGVGVEGGLLADDGDEGAEFCGGLVIDEPSAVEE
jgi:hypothetical protein